MIKQHQRFCVQFFFSVIKYPDVLRGFYSHLFFTVSYRFFHFKPYLIQQGPLEKDCCTELMSAQKEISQKFILA